MTTESSLDNRKILSAVSHGSVFISALVISIGIPIAIYTLSEDAVVKENAKEAINFHLNVWLVGAIIAVASFFTLGLLGFILGPIWLLVHWGLSVWAIIYSLQTPDKAVRYPFILRIV
ncbi:hypothetical protein NIES4102_26440 [Chondrocystis sp. NIES-4102]|nr:hypothetical protein NIES4102_26440 [Chondrocystis sp. NIES-4102]